MPVADPVQGAGIDVGADLARIKQHHQHCKKHHIACQRTENKGPGAIKHLARATAGIFPVVVASAASATRGTAVNGRFASGSRGLALDLDGMGVKMDGIAIPVRIRLLPLSFGRIHNRKRGLGARKKLSSRAGRTVAKVTYLLILLARERVESLDIEVFEISDVSGGEDQMADAQ